MSKKKVHLYINPRNDREVCGRSIHPDELYKWNMYQRSNRKTIDCFWCRRLAGLPEKKRTNK